jgi:hypothetical protein
MVDERMAGMQYEHRTMQGRRHAKPDVYGCNWTDADMEPFLCDDYDTDEQSIPVQMMLELAEELANARAKFALASSRAEQDRIGGLLADRHGAYEPRTCDISITRRGFSVSRNY